MVKLCSTNALLSCALYTDIDDIFIPRNNPDIFYTTNNPEFDIRPVAVRSLAEGFFNDAVDAHETIRQVDARLKQFVMIVNQLDPPDFTNGNRQNIFTMFRKIVQDFPRISLVVEDVLPLLRSAVQGITSMRGAVGTNPATRFDAHIALVQCSITHEITLGNSQDDQSRMSENMAKLVVDMQEHVKSQSLKASEALLIFGRALAVERGTAKALNEFGKMDSWVKGLSNEIGIEPDLWRVARTSIGHCTPKDTIAVTMGHLHSDLHRLRDAVMRPPQETVSAGKGRKSAWTDIDLHNMSRRSESFRQKNPPPRHEDMQEAQKKRCVKEDKMGDNSAHQAQGKKRKGGGGQEPKKKSKSDGGVASSSCKDKP